MSKRFLVRVRVWVDEGSGRAPEQRPGVLREPLPQTAICFSGGGTRSMAATVGQLRALSALGLLDDVGYLSCVSGSAWAVVPYLYATDVEQLGSVTPPGDLTLAGLEAVDPQSLLHPATVRFRDSFDQLEADRGVDRDQVWVGAVGKTFLAPFGLYDPNTPHGFGPEAESLGPSSVQSWVSDAPCHRPRVARPFPVVHATLRWPERRSSAQHMLPFEYTPLYVGSPQRRVIQDTWDGERTVGGTLVEPAGFGSTAPEAPADQHGHVAVEPPTEPFTLADMVGASTAFNAEDRDVRGYPHRASWTMAGADGGPGWCRDLFTDGGDVDTFALLGMLRRRIPTIVVFLNSIWPLSLDYDPAQWPEPGDIDPAIPPLFGHANPRWPHNRVFSQDGYRDLVAAWQSAKREGRPLVAHTRLRVEDNEWWGIEGGWDVSVCWVYNDRVAGWEGRLIDEVRQVLPADAGGDPRGPLARFPHYLTVGQNAGDMTRLTPLQANLLAELAGWTVLESAETLRSVLV